MRNKIFSILMSVYKDTNSKYLNQAINSTITSIGNSSISLDEIEFLIAADGYISDQVQRQLEKASKNNHFIKVPFEKSRPRSSNERSN